MSDLLVSVLQVVCGFVVGGAAGIGVGYLRASHKGRERARIAHSARMRPAEAADSTDTEIDPSLN